MLKAVSGIFLAGAISAHANLIVNGSFENNGGAIIQNNGSWVLYNPLSGWTSTGVVEVQSNGVYGSGSTAYDGTHWLELDAHLNNPGSVAIMQTINTDIGEAYSLTFAFAGRPGQTASQNVLDVAINNSTTRITKGSVSGSLNWELYTLSFIGTGSDKIYFADGGLATPSMNNTYGTLLDAVSVVKTVPEPGTMGLLGLGLVAMAGVARKRFGKKA